MAFFKKTTKEEKKEEQQIVPAGTALKTVGASSALIIKRPHISERASDEAAQGVYVFDVDTKATKPQIRSAIKALFKVTPIKVRTVTVHPRKILVKGRPGVRSGGKKAYVHLKKGEKIEVV